MLHQVQVLLHNITCKSTKPGFQSEKIHEKNYFRAMTVFPHAKINIGLHVIAKLADGYHRIETVLYPVKIHDVLEMIPHRRGKSLEFSVSGDASPLAVEDNLCVKAFRLLEKRFDLPPVKMHLHKTIPSGAGLGGGSSDAAYTLRLANELFGLGMHDTELAGLARQLGSDCAFFIDDRPAYAFGKGDQLRTSAVDLSGCFLVVVMPPHQVSTAAAYRQVVPRRADHSLEQSCMADPSTWKGRIRNDFEATVFRDFPVLPEIKDMLYREGAVYASMSGSGAALYGIFPEKVALPALERECRVFYDV